MRKTNSLITAGSRLYSVSLLILLLSLYGRCSPAQGEGGKIVDGQGLAAVVEQPEEEEEKEASTSTSQEGTGGSDSGGTGGSGGADEGSGGSGGSVADGTGGAGGSGGSSIDTGSGGADIGTGTNVFGSPCETDSDCETGVCRPYPGYVQSGVKGMCSRHCEGNKDACLEGEVCVTSGVGVYCAPKCGSDADCVEPFHCGINYAGDPAWCITK